MARLPEIPVDLYRQYQNIIFGEKADDIQSAESFRWGVDDSLGTLPPDDGTNWEAEARRLEEEQQRRQEEQRKQIEEQARRDQEDYQRIEEERAVAARANELARNAPPGTSTYNDPTAGGTIDQPLPPQSPAPASFSDTANSLITNTFGPSAPATAASPMPEDASQSEQYVQSLSQPSEPVPPPLRNNISHDPQTNTYGPASDAPAEPLSAPEPPKPLSFADQANNLITGAFGPESPIGQAASGAYNTAVRGGMPDVIDIARKGDEAARVAVPYAIDNYGVGKGLKDDARIRELQAEASGGDTSNRGILDPTIDPAWAAANPEKAQELDDLTIGRTMTVGGMAGAGGGGGIARDAIDAIKALRSAGMSEAALNAERELAMKSPMTLEQIQQQTGAAIKKVADAVLPKPPVEPPLAAEVPNPSPLTAEERALNGAADARAREAPSHGGYLEDPTFGVDESPAAGPQPGTVRLYHGSTVAAPPGASGAASNWFTDTAETARWYADREGGGPGAHVRYVDVPEDVAKAAQRNPNGEMEWFLPGEWANRARPLEEAPRSGPQPGDNIRLPDGTRARVEAPDAAPPRPAEPAVSEPPTGPQPGDRVRLPDGTRATVETAPSTSPAKWIHDRQQYEAAQSRGDIPDASPEHFRQRAAASPEDAVLRRQLQARNWLSGRDADAAGAPQRDALRAEAQSYVDDLARGRPVRDIFGPDDIRGSERRALIEEMAREQGLATRWTEDADGWVMRAERSGTRLVPADSIKVGDEIPGMGRVVRHGGRADPYGEAPSFVMTVEAADGTRRTIHSTPDLSHGRGRPLFVLPEEAGGGGRLPDGTRATVIEGGGGAPPTGRPPAPPSGGPPLPPGGGGAGPLAPTVHQPPRTMAAGGGAPLPPPPGGGGRQAPPGGWPGPGGGGLPPQVPPPPGATPAQVAAAAGASARRGQRLNQGVTAPGSEVPARVRLVTQTTDPQAALRWVEDMLTEPLHGKKLAQYDPQRASTHALINASGIANNRIVDELEPAVLDAAKKGLQHELPAYLEDLHQRDILREFYRRGYEEQLAKTPNNQVQAQRAGMAKMRTREGANREMTYTSVDARLQAQEQALRANGKWNDLQKAAQSIWDANAETLRRATRAGEVSPQDAAYYQWAYPHYVPTVPVSHLDPKGGGQVIGVAGSNLVTRGGTPYIRALDDVGTAGERLNPIAATRNAMIRGERAAARNKIAEQFVRIFDDAVQGGVIKPPTTGQTRRLWEGTEPIVWFDQGVPQRIDVPKIVADGIASSSNIQADEFANLYKRAVRGMVQNITGRRGGFFVTNFVRDARDYGFRRMAEEGPHHAIGIAGTWMDEAGKALADIARSNANVRGVTGAATGAASGLATTNGDDDLSTRLRRAGEGAVLGAIFLGANPTRPTGKALQYVERGGSMGGVSATWKAGQDWYKALLADSGIIRNPNDLAKFMTQWGKEIATFHGLQGVNERTELIARTAASRRAERTGTPALGSMIAGRNASIDFDRYGTAIRAINGYIPFVGARTQGAAQFYRTLHDHPMMTTATVLATVAPVVAATEAYNRANPERAQAYDDVPTYLKDSGIVVMMPWAGSDARGKRPNYLWVPSQIDAPFIMALRAAMERMPGMESSANPRGAGEIAAALASSMMPVNAESPLALAGSVMPPVVRQAAELGSNTDFYRGTAIASEFNDQRASALGRGVAAAAQGVGQRTGSDVLSNVRPSHIDYLLRQLPAYGDIATGASDLVAPNAYKQAEDRPIQNEPFTGGLVGRFVRDTGGDNLRRLRAAAWTDYVKSVVTEAGVRPGDLDLGAPAAYGDMPLTREEQVMAQEAFNAHLEDEIERKQNLPAWDRPERRRELLLSAITTAKNRARSEVMREIPMREKQERKSDAEVMKAGG